MPMITVDWLAGRSAEQKRDLAKAITDAFIAIAKVTPEQVWIAFNDVPRSDWAMGGKLLAPSPEKS
jgi:4-oxalocrotonate tautomerase